MNTIISLLLVSLAIFMFVSWIASRPRGHQLHPLANTLPANVGSSKNSRRYLSSAAIATRYLLAKVGADDEHIAVVAATADKPIGVITDEAAAAEDPVNVELLGVTNRTLPMVAAGAIAIGADVYATAAGKVDVKPTAAGTYWRVGVALTASGANNDPIEIALSKPRKLIVIAALTNTAGDIADTNSTAVNPTKADFDSLLVAAGKLQADFLVLAAALNSDADIAYATS
jgi:hypothetical protein